MCLKARNNLTSVAGKINIETTSMIKNLFLEYIETIYSPSNEYKKIGKVAKRKREKEKNLKKH